MIKAVIFDMDGVLFDTERIMKQGWEKAASEMGFTITEEQLKHMRGSSRERSAALFSQWYHGTVDYEKGRAIRAKYLEDYISRYSIPEKKGLRELLTYLKQEGIPSAVATSTNRTAATRYWEMADIASFFTASVCGNEISQCKPAPDIFLKAAELLHTSPQNCLVVEDSINGLKAAKAALALSCMVPDLTPYTPDLAPICDYVCRDLLDVKKLIRQLRS